MPTTIAKPTRRCQGRRRMWRGHTQGVFPCGRKATTIVETRVGLSRSYYVCDDPECFDHIAGGYPAHSKALT